MSNQEAWTREIKGVILKEIRCEMRSKAGFYTAGLFSLVTVVAIWFASSTEKLSPTHTAGLLWVALIFAAVLSLPRSFVLEEEQGTGDLLRLWAHPHAVFWGKGLFNFAQMALNGLVLSLFFFLLTSTSIEHIGLYILSIVGGTAALAGSTTLCAALASRASNRWTLVGSITLPLLLPMIAIGITATRVALGDGSLVSGQLGCMGLACYAVATFATGPYLYAAVWRS